MITVCTKCNNILRRRDTETRVILKCHICDMTITIIPAKTESFTSHSIFETPIKEKWISIQ